MRCIVSTRNRRHLLLALTWLVCAGCDRLPDTVSVSGTVSYNDTPLNFGTVTFLPVAGGQPARATIQPDGSYQLSTYGEKDGAVPGSHRVRIMCTTAQDPSNPQEVGPHDLMAGNLLIPRRYTQFGSSRLTAEVTLEGENNFDFKLTGKR